ncbi:MAG: hypothetical protein WC699_18735, partial [Bacteroidales bacterium]
MAFQVIFSGKILTGRAQYSALPVLTLLKAKENMAADIKALLSTEYTLSGEISRLAGENENYRIETPDGASFVLKLAGEDTPPGILEMEHLAVESLVRAGLGVALPRVIPTRTGAVEACVLTGDREKIRGRLLAFVPGEAWCKAL